MALYKGSTKLAGISKGFSPSNAGTTGQVLTKTNDGYAYADAPVTSVNGSTGAINVNDIKRGTTAPSNPTEGMAWYDTTNAVLKVYDGTDWNEVGSGGAGDMAYADFERGTKTGASITLDLNSTITPTANFTVNKPSEIKEGQVYVLRVTSGATAYTMALGTGINNPWNVDLSLTENETSQFVFLATSSNTLELQKIGGGEIEYVTESEYENLPSSKLTNGVSYFIYE